MGNHFASAATLETHIGTRKTLLGLFGKYHADMLEEDRQKLVDYYYANGFFEAKVTPVTRSLETPGEIELMFVVSEGTQYRVRNVIIEGNRRIKTEALREGPRAALGQAVHAGGARCRQEPDVTSSMARSAASTPRSSASRGLPTSSGSSTWCTRSTSESRFRSGELDIVGNDRTKDKVIRREAVMAGLLPGEVLDKNRIEIFRRRLMGLGYFMNDPQQGKQIKIDIVRQRPSDQPYSDLMTPYLAGLNRGADAGPGLGERPASGTGCRPRRRAREPRLSPMLAGVESVRRESIRSIRRPTCRQSTYPRPPPLFLAVLDRVPAALPPPVGAAENSGLRPEHPRHEHDRRQPRPQRRVPEPVVRRHRDVDRRDHNRSLHDRRRGQQLSGLDRQRADL